MSWWDDYPSGPKPPPPEHGIKIKKAGTTWWGQRWIQALEGLSPIYSSRLARGKTYARAGRAHDLVIAPGLVTAKVAGSRPDPYEVQIRLTPLGDAEWKKVIVELASRALFAAELLAGRMPNEIESAFTGVGLFPRNESDLRTSCNCPDVSNPCKHIAATHYVLGDAFDRDPFLLFELRGKSKATLLDALRAARGGGKPKKEKKRTAPEIPKVDLAGTSHAHYDLPRGELPTLTLSFEAPSAHGAALRQLGAPATWKSEVAPADLLAPLIEAAAERARNLALAETEEPATIARKPRKR